MATKDVWIYQDREVNEPWAVHVWLHDSGMMDVKVYAEYLTGYHELYADLYQTPQQLKRAIMNAVRFCAIPSQEWTDEDDMQIDTIWRDVIAAIVETLN